MANRTAWVAGNGVGLTYTTAINTGDMASLSTGSAVLSSVADITNGTALDMFMDISYLLAISSNTVTAGASISFWIYNLNEDGTHYGDNQFSSGAASALTPSFAPAAVGAIPAVASTTNMYGTITGITIPPGSFRLVVQNNSGFILTSGTQTVKYRTYNINLNN